MLTRESIQKNIADSDIIFFRGKAIHENGDLLYEGGDKENLYYFRYDGNYGEYAITVDLLDRENPARCDCPYPGDGCKHVVASLLTVLDMTFPGKVNPVLAPVRDSDEGLPEYLTEIEIRDQALEDRKQRAKKELFRVIQGDQFTGDHLLETASKRSYRVVLHDPAAGTGHCSCPDYLTNRLGTCKHLIFLGQQFKKATGFNEQVKKEIFPFADVFWDSATNAPRLYFDARAVTDTETRDLLGLYFQDDGSLKDQDLAGIPELLASSMGLRQVLVQPEVVARAEARMEACQLAAMAPGFAFDYSTIRASLYDYQKQGVEFSLFKKAVLIGDEMGLGKTLQAITLAVLKQQVFGFKKVLIITLASLKDQWKREIIKFTGLVPEVVEGSVHKRRAAYRNTSTYFKITNYEAVLRDVTIISAMKPDLIILDEAQRIKNFNTKTSDAVKQLPRDHAIVLTGTPLENKLEDVYSIIQFLDPFLVSPLWDFAGRHFMLSRKKKGRILGYRNLESLRERLGGLVIRRKKQEVLKDLPDTVTNEYFIDLSHQQLEIHDGCWKALLPLLSKKFLTPMDIQKIQMLLLKMRMVCNSTYLIDKKTHISPKLDEFKSIIHDMAVENQRKVVVFSEWTTMTFLVAKHLSDAGIPFVELSGKVPVKKRQKLIDEFTLNPECRVFLSTDAGGTGLNLQAADCVVNFELPWNPARLSQRVGRVNRIGQTSRCINVVNLIAKRSIEEKILSGIQMKTELFKSVFEDGDDVVDFSNEKRAGLINTLRTMMGEEADEVARPVQADPVEIPDDTPHYLNPSVLGPDDEGDGADQAPDSLAALVETEPLETGSAQVPEKLPDSGGRDGAGLAVDYAAEPAESWEPEPVNDSPRDQGNVFAGQTPERIESVLNSGMAFISGLMEMATGQKLAASGEKLLTIDRATGEITMKFKLPGF
ncbi:MAG: SNF2-related protein [Pseudomonadota bacterium]